MDLMDLLKILLPVFLFLAATVISLVVYIWHDAKKSISLAMTVETCEIYRTEEEESMERLCTKLRNHRHKEDGSVEVLL